jgi:hypothetical protein
VVDGLELAPFIVLIGLILTLVVAGLLLTERLRLPASEGADRVAGLWGSATGPIGVTSRKAM